MGEKRRAKRHARRLRVRFGARQELGFPHVGITSDVSASGLFVISSARVKPGDRLHLELTMQDEKPLYTEVVVARRVDVPAELRQVVHAGFGVRYLTGLEVMGELVPSLLGDGHRTGTVPVFVPPDEVVASSPSGVTARNEPPPKADAFTQVFDSPVAWREAVEREFKRGGAFLWCPEPQSSNAVVTLVFDLRFASRKLPVSARVVHSSRGSDGRYGVALMFTDPGAVALLTGVVR